MTIDEIIDRIGFFRNRANLSARALSLEIDRAANYINLLENKRDFEPSLSTLLAIIEACDSTPDEFFYCDYSQFKKDKELLCYIQNLSPNQKEAILNLYKI